MAKNTGKGYRRGAVDDRTQFKGADGHWRKRDSKTGKIMDTKSDDKPFKGVAKEPDNR